VFSLARDSGGGACERISSRLIQDEFDSPAECQQNHHIVGVDVPFASDSTTEAVRFIWIG
jgi:hypothetical protein